MRSLAVLVGLVTGAAVGWAVAQRHRVHHRQDLFNRRALRRLSALGGIEVAGEVAGVRLLKDYLQWERLPVLRHRALAIVRRLEAVLGYTPPGT